MRALWQKPGGPAGAGVFSAAMTVTARSAGSAIAAHPDWDPARVRAITLDLDDTLWPIWPTIARAEAVLHAWLQQHAPATAARLGDAQQLRTVRERIVALRPDLQHDLSALRRESIRLALTESGDDPALAEPAFELFFAERQRVDLFDDVHAALDQLAARFPVVALTNGNADVARVGLARYFRHSISAREFGVAKPDVRIFQAAAAQAGVSTAAVLHGGDDARLDVEGALQAGMQAVWVNRQASDWTHGFRAHLEVPHLHALCAAL